MAVVTASDNVNVLANSVMANEAVNASDNVNMLADSVSAWLLVCDSASDRQAGTIRIEPPNQPRVATLRRF